MKEALIMIAMSALATLGFSIVFYVHPRRLPLATLSGVLTCGIYLLTRHFLGGEFIPNLIAAAVGAVYSELCARLTRVPVPVYMLPAIIPLVPGSRLYDTMFRLVAGEYEAAAASGLATLRIALGIAGGIIAVSVVSLFIRPRKQTLRKR